MPKLFIPTRNRPSSLGNVLSFLTKFYPKTDIIIADGSNKPYKSAYKKIIKSLDTKLNIQYFSYDSSLPMAERVVNVLNKFNDEFIIFGADDDYPLMDTFLDKELFLKKNPDYVMALGGIVGLRLLEDNEAQVKLLHSRTIEKNSPTERINDYIKWPFPTSYALVRREHFLDCSKHWDFGALPGFGDFTMGFHSCIAGKIKTFEKICYFSTTNKTHSNIRRKNNLFYVERPQDILSTKQHYKKTLLNLSGMSKIRAENISTRLVNTRVAELITPALQNTEGFGRSKLFNEKEVNGQYQNFINLFKKNSVIRKKLLPQFRDIINKMIELESKKTDNLNEPKIYHSQKEMK